jgi:hypothetical protein
MVSISAIARDWHVSRPYVSRCVNHRACPTKSLADAREWRECYASKKPSVARQTDEPEERNPPQDNTLIPLAAAKDIAFRGYDFILDLVDRLPKIAAAQCNPGNPQMAFAVLESECTYISCKAYEAYAAWSKGGPHISTATDAE